MVFTLLAIGELIADKPPHRSSRTAPPGLIARILMGGLTGACMAVSGGHTLARSACCSAIGGVVGCFAGYWARTRLVKVLGTRDLNVALIEDIIAIAGSIWLVASV